MGWLGTLTGVGNVGTDLGNADTQEREFQLKQQQAQSEAAYKTALAQFNLGNLDLEKQKFAAGRWSVDNSNPYISNPDGSVSLVEHDRNGGAPRLTPMPKGFQIPNSIGDLTATLRRNFPDATPDQIRDMVSYKLGLKSPWAALSPQTSVDANGNPVVGVLNKGTGVFTPSTTAGGAPVAKPVPTKFQTVTDAAGNQRSIPVPAFSHPQGRGAAAPVAAQQPAAGGNPTAPSTADPYAKGLLKKPAMLSQEAAKEIENVNMANTLSSQIIKDITDQKLENANSVTDRLKGAAEWAKYSAGFRVDDPLYNHILSLTSLLKTMGTSPYLHGIRNMKYIAQIQQHMPNPTDTPASMLQKAQNMQSMMKDIQNAIYDSERSRVKGIPVTNPSGPVPSPQGALPAGWEPPQQ